MKPKIYFNYFAVDTILCYHSNLKKNHKKTNKQKKTYTIFYTIEELHKCIPRFLYQ